MAQFQESRPSSAVSHLASFSENSRGPKSVTSLKEKVMSGGQSLIKNFLSCPCITCIPSCLKTKRPKTANQSRTVIPNHRLADSQDLNAKYLGNEIKTTKYTIFTFLPKNLFEQFHRFANLYFIFIVLLNWVPEINAFGKEISIIPILFVLSVTAIKDLFEDRRRYKSDQKINHTTCRVYNRESEQYQKTEWCHVRVGDVVHLSCNEVVPADMLLLHSSDALGTCFLETSNLDGESNLKQRQVITSLQTKGGAFHAKEFLSTVECEQPNNRIYQFNGFLLHSDGSREAIGKNNLLLRGCQLRNTDFIEAIVLYAGHETKAMLNNSGPRYKRSKLEKLMNWDILWCVLILMIMCLVGAIGSGVWLGHFKDVNSVPFLAGFKNSPAMEAFINFWSYIIILQVMIPISLYVTIELVKLGQIFFVTLDQELYYAPTDKKIQCRALNIPEEIGQVEFVMSDKTGTLTENQMIFRRCCIGSTDYGARDINNTEEQSVLGTDSTDAPSLETSRDVKANPLLLNKLRNLSPTPDPSMESFFHFFMNLAICNTVVVSPHPHRDRMNASGYLEGSLLGNGSILNGSTPRSTPSELATPATPAKDFSHIRHSLTVPQILVDTSENKRGNLQNSTDQSDNVSRVMNGHETTLHPLSIETSPRPKTLSLAQRLLPSGLKELLTPRLSPRSSSPSLAAASMVSPGYPNPYYEAESPDELALVYAAAAYHVRLVKRQAKSVTLEFPEGSLEKYETLYSLPFDSVRKRMSVVLRMPKTGEIVMYSKGADSAMLDHLSSEFEMSARGQAELSKAQEYINLYASYGLRTLCLCKRIIPQDVFEKWAREHDEAELAIEDRDEQIFQSSCQIEKDFELLGVTAIEDRLQDGVAECIAALRCAGMKVWVLTGDKIETAVNIAYACKLFTYGMQLIQFSARDEAAAQDYLEHQLDMIDRHDNVAIDDGVTPATASNRGLVVDGTTLAFCIPPASPKMEDLFTQLVSQCTSVLICRATPLQKASVVKIVKEKLGALTLAIGDGANDVGMIQCADVGIGISGQEGMQAVMSSDYAIARFRFLKRLLLVHGHWCYHRLATMVLYFFYKNAMFVFTEFWFQVFNGWSAQVNMDPLYLMFYNLLFTSLPILLMGILDQDVNVDLLVQKPHLYIQGSENRLYRTYSFWLNMADAIWQSLVIFFVPFFIMNDSEARLWDNGTMVFTAICLCNHAHILLEAKSWNAVLLGSIAFSVALLYSFCLIYNVVTATCCAFDPAYYVSENLFSQAYYWLGMVLIIVLAILPRWTLKVVSNSLFPSDVLQARLIGERQRRDARRSATATRPYKAVFKRRLSRVSVMPVDDEGRPTTGQRVASAASFGSSEHSRL